MGIVALVGVCFFAAVTVALLVSTVVSAVQCRTVPLFWVLALIGAAVGPFVLKAPLPVNHGGDYGSFGCLFDVAFSKFNLLCFFGAVVSAPLLFGHPLTRKSRMLLLLRAIRPNPSVKGTCLRRPEHQTSGLMSVASRFEGNHAVIKQDDSVSNALLVFVAGSMGLLLAGALLRLSSYVYAFAIPGLMVLAGYLVERPIWGRQTIEIDRTTSTLTRKTPRTTRQVEVSSFTCVLLLQSRMPRRQVHYAVRLMTDRGMIQVAMYGNHQWAETLSRELAAWLSVPVVNEERASFLGFKADRQLFDEP